MYYIYGTSGSSLLIEYTGYDMINAGLGNCLQDGSKLDHSKVNYAQCYYFSASKIHTYPLQVSFSLHLHS